MLTTLATLAALALAQQTDTTVPVRSGARLEISNYGGEITVKTWSRNAVRVVADHSSRDRIRIDASDQVVRVKTEPGRRGPSQIDYAVTVDRKSTRLNSSHSSISYAVFCLKKKKQMT